MGPNAVTVDTAEVRVVSRCKIQKLVFGKIGLNSGNCFLNLGSGPGASIPVVFSSGLAEPASAIIGYAILRPFLTPALLSTLLAAVAGIMAYISLVELSPVAHRYSKQQLVVTGIMEDFPFDLR